MPVQPSNKVEELFLSEFEKLYAGERPAAFYHYTSAAGMRAIIETGQMRAFNVQFMNDHAELRYSASVMRAHIDRAYAVEPDPLFSDVLSCIRRTQIPLDLNQLFLLSFSPDGDELGMWGLYAERRSGFAFAFDPHDIAGVPNSLILPCKYDPSELRDFCMRCLIGLREIVLQDRSAGTAQSAQHYADEFLKAAVWFAPVFKPQVWSDEREWRMVITRPGTHHQHLEDGRHYINIPGPDDGFARFPVRAVCIGPECDYATAGAVASTATGSGIEVQFYHSKFGIHPSFINSGTANSE